jgi:predicted DNA-binding transcriptional regulator YafY
MAQLGRRMWRFLTTNRCRRRARCHARTHHPPILTARCGATFMNDKRITRLLRLLRMLHTGAGQNSAALAKACGVTRRTIFRDLESLRRAGVPLEFDQKAQRFSISGAFFLPPTNFTAEEALSILALAGEMGRSERLPFFDAAYTAAIKLEGNLPAALRKQLRSVTRAIKIRPTKVSRLAGKDEIYHSLVAAIESRRVVKMQYDSFTEWERITTKLRPYRLLFSRHSWYVAGRSALHREVRIFNLTRIASLKRLGERFVVPRDFDIDKYLGNAWNLIPNAGRDSHVVVRFKPLVAGNVAEVVWHKTQRTARLEDGSLEFRVTVSGLNEIAWWILGYGDQAEVLPPARLRRLIAQRAQNMATMYNGS